MLLKTLGTSVIKVLLQNPSSSHSACNPAATLARSFFTAMLLGPSTSGGLLAHQSKCGGYARGAAHSLLPPRAPSRTFVCSAASDASGGSVDLAHPPDAEPPKKRAARKPRAKTAAPPAEPVITAQDGLSEASGGEQEAPLVADAVEAPARRRKRATPAKSTRKSSAEPSVADPAEGADTQPGTQVRDEVRA